MISTSTEQSLSGTAKSIIESNIEKSNKLVNYFRQFVGIVPEKTSHQHVIGIFDKSIAAQKRFSYHLQL